MSKEAVFTMKLEYELRSDFMAEAAATNRPASQLVRDFMRDFIEHQRHLREHDVWFKNQVRLGMNDDPSTIPHEEVMAQMKDRISKRMISRKNNEN